MRDLPRPCLLLAGVVLACTPWSSSAQEPPRDPVILLQQARLPLNEAADPGPSHVPLPVRPGGQKRDTEKLFKERFGQPSGLSQFRKDVKQLFGKELEEVIQDFKQSGIDPNDKEFQKAIEKTLRENKLPGLDRKLTPEEIEAARRLRDALPKSTPLPKIDTPKVSPGTLPDDKHRPPEHTTEPRKETPTTAPEPTQPGPTRTAATQEGWREQLTRWLMKQTTGLEGLGKYASDSPALRGLLRDLAVAMQGGPEKHGALDRIDAQLSPYANLWSNGDPRLDAVLSGLGDMSLPHFSGVQLSSSSGPSPAAVPPVGGAPAAAVSWTSGLWFLTLLVLAVVLWKLLRVRLPFLAPRAEESWHLGPWPVRPEAVATREELVRGFEYLSLLLLGRQARTWNHREIAGRLGGQEADRQRAAAELSAVYEKARYAPPDDPLSAEALAAARRDLCYLAGVTAV